ncbi:hypothetical protein Peur_058177 [Populus x canadensis]
MDTGNWRIQLQHDSQKRIVDKIMETLKRHLSFSAQEGLQELKKIAIRLEEKIYTTATNQFDYLRKISLEMLSMEISSQNAMPAAPMDPEASHSMPPQVQNQGLFLPLLLSTDQSQARQQLVSQNMQSIPGVSQNSVGNSMGQGIPSTMFANSQRQMPALCATAAIYGISNATAIETIAITRICYHIIPSSALHQLFTFSF